MIWVLFGIEVAARPQQSFEDIIRRHRNNAFVLDLEAVAASREKRTLVLNCYLKGNEGFDAPRLVRIDELTIPRSNLPYWQDRIVTPLLEGIGESRQSWFDALKCWDRQSHINGLDREQGLLVAAAFSIVAAANGRENNYASNHSNIRAMLNTYLHSGVFASYADLLELLISNTAHRHLLNSSVGNHLERYRDRKQAGQNSHEWRLLRQLLPEALDPIVRQELNYYDALPDWAVSAS